MNELMEIGNQAYHYMFGLALTDDSNEEFAVSVDTTIGCAFDELLQTNEVYQGQLDDVPIFRLPAGLDYDNGEKYVPFLSTDTEIGRAKSNYLSALSSVLGRSDAGSGDRAQDLRNATREYEVRINQLLGERESVLQPADKIIESTFTLGMGTFQNPNSTSAVAANTPGLAVGIHAESSQESREILLERYSLKDAGDEFNPNEQLIELKDLRPQIAGLSFDKDAAAEFIKDIPKFYS